MEEDIRKSRINCAAVIIITLFAFAAAFAVTACDVQDSTGSAAKAGVHVAADGSDTAGNGTEESPYATVSRAAEAAPGSLIVVHGGTYGPIRLGADCSGSATSPTIIRVAEGETAVIHAGDGAGVSLTDVSHISVEGLEITGGTHGIDYRSSREAGEQPLTDICIKECRVHGVGGVHGISIYACNDLAPVRDLVISGCEVYDCDCGSSESVVLNGNIDGFLIAGNRIHDNNNIGIDMIGFEGTAKHPDQVGGGNLYENDQVRNGVCRDNVVYNISSEGNPAYDKDGEYDLCADGIYVDGGRDIEICCNFIFRCDIGLEVATEHSPDENELFRVSGVRVHDNVIADCNGWAGLCFGGYDEDLGFTEDCAFDHNTLVDNELQIAVQRSRNNQVTDNLIIGGKTAVKFSEECKPEDMVNEISRNILAGIRENGRNHSYGRILKNREDAADGFRSLIENAGSDFVPDEKMMNLR